MACDLSLPTGVTGKVIALDPGHGGTETGATYTYSGGLTLMEKDLNLAVANWRLRILRILRRQGKGEASANRPPAARR
jgi:N-acetylmuramoyl-L-alanine amidase